MDNRPNLILLPDEILLQIFKDQSLSVKDIYNLCMTCHRFEYICQSQVLWKSKFLQKWPWVWKRILPKEKTNEDWKNEVYFGIKLAKTLHEKLEIFSYRLYKCHTLTSPVLASILNLLDTGSFAIEILLNELKEILNDISHPLHPPHHFPRVGVNQTFNDIAGRRGYWKRAWNPLLNQRPNWVRVLPGQGSDGTTTPIHLPTYRDLTKKYYASHVLYHLSQDECRGEWMQFFRLPPYRQTLEKGAFYLAKWFQPKEFLHYEYKHMTDELDKLALESLSHLRKQYPQHPAVAHNLFDPEDNLKKNSWTIKECEQIFECVNHIIYTVNKYQGNEDYYLMANSLINKVIETKKGIPVTLSIIYKAVCHRLGIMVYPVNCPSHFMLKWRLTDTDDFEFIDAFHGGARIDYDERLFHRNHPTLSRRNGLPCYDIEVLMRMANNTVHIAERNFQHEDRFEEIVCAVEISAMFKANDVDSRERIYNLYLKTELHLDRVIAGCTEVLDMNLVTPRKMRMLKALRQVAQVLLVAQEKDPKPLVSKHRSSDHNVLFATGMVMRHKAYGYTCVIFGWDTTCMMPTRWILQMNVYSLEHQTHQPFYNVLVSDGSRRYAAQENLLPTDPVLVTNAEVGKYFEEFNGYHYLPNNELATEYPEEEMVRRKHYPNLYK